MKNHKIEVETLDQIMYIAENGSDQQMRCYIEFDCILDQDIMRKSVMYTLKSEKIILHRINEGFFKVSWGKLEDSSAESVFRFVNVDKDIKNDVMNFLIKKIDAQNDPQIQITLLRFQNKDYLVFNVHHDVTDSAGLLTYIKKVALIYNELKKNSSYLPLEYTIIDRSIKPLIKKYKLFKRINIIMTSFNIALKGKIYSFPWSTTEKNRTKNIMSHKFTEEKLNKLNDYCYKNKCSLNDYIITIFYKSFFSLRNEVSALNTSCNPLFLTVDFRNYNRVRNQNALFNFSSGILLQPNIDPSLDFETILVEVKNLTKSVKVDFKNYDNQKIPGLNTVFLLNFLLKILPFKIVKKMACTMQKDILAIPYYSNVGNVEMYVNGWDGASVIS